jgi:L-ascorbate metabolism protein UlaG (beta-lactamase superfamily)
MPAPTSLTLTLIGGPTALLELGGLRLLTDPTFDPPGSYEGAVTLTKETAPALPADAVGRVDAVLLSHDQHFDNLDRSGREFLAHAGRVFTTPAGAGRVGGKTEGLAPWQHATVRAPSGAALRITATPARHGPVGIEPLSGDVTGFALTFGEGPAVYVSGDTVWYEGVAEVARRFKVAVAILFTGSAEPRGTFHMTMDSNDALEAAHAFPNAKIVAIHNEGWAHFKESEAQLANSFRALGLADRLQNLERGKRVAVPFQRGVL